MLFATLFLILGMSFFVASLREKIHVFYLTKICSFFYLLRIISFIPLVLIFGFIFDGLLNTISRSDKNVLYFILSVLIYGISYLVNKRIIFTSLLRTSEIAARFTLDLLPGEQLAVDIAKRDGLVSVLEADKNRKILASTAISVGSLEPKVRMLGSECLSIFCFSILATLFSFLLFGEGSEYFQQIAKFGILALMVGSVMLGSSSLTSATFFDALGDLDKSKKNSIDLTVIAAKTFKLAVILGFAAVPFDIILFTGAEIVKAILLDSLILILLFTAYAFFKLKNGFTDDNLTYRTIPFKNINEIESSNHHEVLGRDLLLTVNLNGVQLTDEFVKKIYQSFSVNEALLIPIEQVFIRSSSDLTLGKNNLRFQWGDIVQDVKIDFKSEFWPAFVNDNFKDFYLPICQKELLISDLSRVFNLFFLQERNGFYKSIDLASLQFIKKSIDAALKYNLQINSIKTFAEICLKHVEEDEMASVFKDLFENNSEALAGKDGISRVIYLENEPQIEVLNTISNVAAKLKSRGLSPLIVISDLSVPSIENVSDCVILNSEIVPSNLKFFPIATL